jgi:hypothetical protein
MCAFGPFFEQGGLRRKTVKNFTTERLLREFFIFSYSHFPRISPAFRGAFIKIEKGYGKAF